MSRFILLGICAYFLLNDNYLFTCVLILAMGVTDILDGYFARSRNEISELGKIIDPIADKVSLLTIILILFFKEIIPLWFVIITVSRDALILVGGLYLNSKKNTVLQSNWLGKAAAVAIGTTLLIAIFSKGAKFGQFGKFLSYHSEITELLYTVLLFLSVVLAIVSLVSYLKRFNEFK